MAKLSEPDLVRIRNNQRRSRARHKKYVADLEERLRQCETKGVEANSQIQQAARKVVQENRRLSGLLNNLGFDNEKISYFLQTGQLDVSNVTTPKFLHDPESMSQTPDLRLQQTDLSTFDYNTPTSTACSPSELSSIGGDVTYALINGQEPTQAFTTGVGEHVQLHSPCATSNIALQLESHGLPEYSASDLPPSYPIAGSQQHPPGLTYQPRGSQLLDSIQYMTDIDCTSHEEEAGKKWHMTDEPVMASYPARERDISYSISPENVYQDFHYQNYTYSDYSSIGEYDKDVANVMSVYLCSSDNT
ncbi:uncharacterized protein GGS22DRAFT_194460 [Annulohypoxylon maeteangense]|uniref:uncharacterized protein n=1 Tax=Annulohypoxylon maeteangense TaxID=1927788 RepID=UPI002008BB71|nr:uncharacterized protein GGS22DRAFT_194460 [Annulohypoxylon maeteangense]KAI0890345.1 hypothetical protein GGS22DRAFT_194460 [Annulohypoxylon maeteangense]